ncbi:mandelate racemase/muconate lactonizing enzyme family protein [Halorarum halobium]|uniref:mandelate racemase/muconate lactonizing enzyme family protein n=1 Tax=Halorarum halobium TaxID=3075121 RepID=UPI0028A60925|nr:mandelate racemase/muconate lactonizing enzyme family protein [Halobaculum sp. XH14]
MAIERVEAVPVAVDVKPLEEEFGLAPYRSNHDAVESRDRMLVRLETGDGLVGWGEMLVAMESATATKTIIEEVIAPELRGREPSEIRSFLESFYFPYTRIHPYLGAVEMAMWDLFGKRVGASVSQLLGGAVTESVNVAYCLGILGPDRSREQARFARDAGFEALKTKAGPDAGFDVERLTAMHEAVDGELEFRIDPNQGWSFEDAVRSAARLEDAGIYLQYLEQPCRIDTPGTYANLRSRIRTPLAVNEDTYFERNFGQLLKRDAVDVGVVDMIPAGGIIRVREQAALAADAGVSLSFHSGFDLGIKTAAMLHTVAATPAISLPPDSVYYAWDEYLVEDPFEIDDGAYPVPESPGLGISVDEDAVQAHRTDT